MINQRVFFNILDEDQRPITKCIVKIENQKEKYEGDQISEINATWGGNNNYFYRPGDYWVLESKRDNMREWIAGFEITAKMDIYVF